MPSPRHLLPALLFLAATLLIASCVPSASPQTAPAKWTTGFWYWNYGYNDPVMPVETVDTLFVHAGAVRQDVFRYTPQGKPADSRWAVWAELPANLPPAAEYWLVFRYELQGVPDPSLVPRLSEAILKVSGQARTRHLNVTENAYLSQR